MAVDDIYQLNVNHVMGGRELSNVFYYSETLGVPTNPVQVALELSEVFYRELWSVWWNRVISSDATLTAIWARRIWPTVEHAATTYFSGDVGSIANDAIPNGSCVLISAHAIGNDANYRRRMYISGLPEVNQELSKVRDSVLGDWQDLADAFTAQELIPIAPGPGKYFPAAYSRKRDAASDPQPWELLAFNRVTSFLRSQRGRNRRR